MNIVKELRKTACIQQKELAIAIGVSNATVSDWEHQKKDPTGDRLKKLAEYFKTTPDVILGINSSHTEKRLTDEDIRFALFGDIQEITEEDVDDVKRYAAFIAARRLNKK